MKKIKKNDLRLEKEVISKLTQSDLTDVRGGIYELKTIINVNCFRPVSYDPHECLTRMGATCQETVCKPCQLVSGDCGIPAYTEIATCEPPVYITG